MIGSTQPAAAPPCFGKPLAVGDESAEFCEDCHHLEGCKQARAKSAAPLPEPLKEALENANRAARFGGKLHGADAATLLAHLSDLTRRLAEAEAELVEVRSRNATLAVQRADAVHLARANPTQAYQRIQQFKERAESAEARVRDYQRAVRVYLAEKAQPGSDRRAELAALRTLEAFAATEAPHA